MAAEASSKETAPEGESEETFTEEIKDYAKTTMNELLGIFGYEDEITQEAVEDLTIKVPRNLGPKPGDKLPAKAEAMEVTPGSLPVIVKVEGNVGGNKMLSQDGNKSELASTGITGGGSGKGNASKPSLAPHFFTSPPRVQGLYCVVARLPVVEGSGENVMTFKFWNCIMCSGYFVDKPEVIFQVNHPQLFVGQPVWLYQAAVCQKCHHTLVTSGPQMCLESSREVCKNSQAVTTTATATVTIVHEDKQQNGHAAMKTAEHSDAVQHREQTFFESQNSVNDANLQSSETQLKCYICSVLLLEGFDEEMLRRSRFPALFCNQSEDVGLIQACRSCYQRLNHQRDRFIKHGISERCRDYAAHIKSWTGSDKFSTLKSKPVSNCFVCDKFLPRIVDSVNQVHRLNFPQIFKSFQSSVAHLNACVGCMEKLQNLQLEFANASDVDYWPYINIWREKKGLPPIDETFNV